jgi:hypothetical protein
VAYLVALDGERIARALGDGRRVFKNRDGWKTYCPLCNSRSRRRRPRATLSLTIRDGKILVYCHRCCADPVAIIRELVLLDRLPNYFRDSSMTLALVNEGCAAAANVTWKGIAETTDVKVLQTLFEIIKQCCKPPVFQRFGVGGWRARTRRSSNGVALLGSPGRSRLARKDHPRTGRKCRNLASPNPDRQSGSRRNNRTCLESR